MECDLEETKSPFGPINFYFIFFFPIFNHVIFQKIVLHFNRKLFFSFLTIYFSKKTLHFQKMGTGQMRAKMEFLDSLKEESGGFNYLTD